MRHSYTSSRRRAGKRQTLILVSALAIILAVGVLAASCGGGGGSTTTAVGPSTTASTPGTTAGGGAGGAQVTLENIQINPASVTIKVGESVTWTNKDSAPHHLVGDKGEFDSGNMDTGATYTFTFKTAGTIAYHCSIHPSMKGTVVAGASTETTAAGVGPTTTSGGAGY